MTHKRIHQGPRLNELEAGNSHICGLFNGTSRLECWQWLGFNSSMAPSFSNLAVGENFVCGLLETGKVSCLGDANSTSIENELRRNYSAITAGFRHVCALSLENDLDCWGAGVKPEGKFTALALGDDRSCALTWLDGTVVCWGSNNFSLPESLRTIHFSKIEAKRSVFCGVAAENFSLYCWGDKRFEPSFMVFDRVMPGPCRSQCPCGPLPGSGSFCSSGLICRPCERQIQIPPAVPITPPPPPPPHLKYKATVWSRKMVAFLVLGCIGSLFMLLVFVFFLIRCCKTRGCRIHDSGRLDQIGTQPNHGSNQVQNPQTQIQNTPVVVLEKRLSQLASMGNAGQLVEFSLQELLEATKNFSEECKIGSGSFGSVYRAVLLDGLEVAVKRAETSNSSSHFWSTKRQEDKNKAFINELESLSRVNHKNLVRLLGFCEDKNELVLVYEYMENGTLHDHLHKLPNSPLRSWSKRIKMALDAARGIEYLHEYAIPHVIHRDIKSSNILLDAMWTAKVSDFGLSLMGPGEGESHLSLRAAGTVGYMDPEYYRLQQLTNKSDVYSLGVVLLELLSGCKAIHKNENGDARNVVDFVVPYVVQDEIHRVLDPKVPPPTPYEIEAVAYVGYLAADCVTLEGKERPSMTEIVNSLEKALTACSMSPPPSPLLSRATTRSSV